MKIQISENIDKTIEGYIITPIVYGVADLTRFPQNCASSIIAIDAVDSIKYDGIEKFIQDVALKMRLNGTLSIGGLDAYALSRDLLGGKINTVQYNQLISNKRSIYSSKDIVQLLSSNKLRIQSVVYKGYFYEISAIRPGNTN